MNKYEELFNMYPCQHDDAQVSSAIDTLLKKHLEENKQTEAYKQCLSCIDLTSLHESDTEVQIAELVEKVNQFHTSYPQLPNVAAICVYPALTPTVKKHLRVPVAIASVAAGFPASQTFIEVKIAETSMVVMEGATEIDVVISIGRFSSGDYETVHEELSEIKSACQDAQLKVILETGMLQSASEIKKAAILSIASGADFIKSSTGKTAVSATPEATYIMCQAIKEWHEKTGEKKGLKVAGGIVTPADALIHYTIVKEVLGKEWLNNSLFRIGASGLANNILSTILGEATRYF